MPETQPDFRDLLAAYRQGPEKVPLHEVGGIAGLDRNARSYIVRRGVIIPAGRGGVGGGYLVTRDDAILILVGAMIAAAAGIATVTAIRGLLGTGLSGSALADALPK